MIEFNLSIDFEMGWGDLGRLAQDPGFHRRVRDGLERTPDVIDMFERNGIHSTWGVVGSCCCGSLEDLRSRASRAFAVVKPQLDALGAAVANPGEVLFCPEMVDRIAASRLIELGSHSFLHLIPNGLDVALLQDDVAASVRILSQIAERSIESFIPPQNYRWPDRAFDQTGIRYVRHTPEVFGYPYSDPRVPAKLARLWNDFIVPVRHPEGTADARLLFLRIDRGQRLWDSQLGLIRRLLRSHSGSLFCFSHPHNLDSAEVLQRLSQFCEVVGEAHAAGRLSFRRFVRELH